jgi:hypothetical protein
MWFVGQIVDLDKTWGVVVSCGDGVTCNGDVRNRVSG